MIVTMVMSAIVRVIGAVIMAAAAVFAVRVIVSMVRVGIDQCRVQLALDRNRGLARGTGVLDRQRHDLGGEPHILDVPEVVPAQAPLAIEQQQRRRAPHLVGGHGPGQACAIGRIDRDREAPSVFVDECLQRLRPHRRMMLEHGVQTDHHDLVVAELPGQALGLRQRVRHAARTQHLERHDNDHLALQRLQGQRRPRVEPAGNGELRRALWIEHDRSFLGILFGIGAARVRPDTSSPIGASINNHVVRPP